MTNHVRAKQHVSFSSRDSQFTLHLRRFPAPSCLLPQRMKEKYRQDFFRACEPEVYIIIQASVPSIGASGNEGGDTYEED